MMRAASMRLAPRRAAGALGLVVLSSCRAVSDVGPSTLDVSGAWNYIATAASSAVTLSGTMTLSQPAGAGSSFTGGLDASQTDARGQVSRVVAIVSGRPIDSSRVEFDLILDASTRRHHSGTVAGDSVSGTWLETADFSIVGSGTFRGKRTRSP